MISYYEKWIFMLVKELVSEETAILLRAFLLIEHRLRHPTKQKLRISWGSLWKRNELVRKTLWSHLGPSLFRVFMNEGGRFAF